MPDESERQTKEQTREWIRAARGKLTQEEFAEKIGVARETVARWESGAIETSYRHIVKIAERFPDAILIDGAPPAARALLPRVDALRLDREMELEADYAKERKYSDRGFLQSLREEFEQRIEETQGEGWAGLPPGLLKFIKSRDADLTPREKTILMKSRVRWDRDFEFDDAFWWLIVKLFLRGFFIPPKDFVLPSQRAEPIPTLGEIEKEEDEREKARLKEEEDKDHKDFIEFFAGLLRKMQDAGFDKKGLSVLTYEERRWGDRLIAKGDERRAGKPPSDADKQTADSEQRSTLDEVFQEWRAELIEKRAEEAAVRKKIEARKKDEKEE